jgi:hypothetical protein
MFTNITKLWTLDAICQQLFNFHRQIIRFNSFLLNIFCYSYSVSGTISGFYQNSTAFVGCDKKKVICCIPIYIYVLMPLPEIILHGMNTDDRPNLLINYFKLI